jgi:hypothetical protein
MFFIGFISVLLILSGVSDTPSDYRQMYESAKRDLAALVEEQQRLERRKLKLRKTVEALAAQCENDNISIEPSEEALEALQSSMADEIRSILSSAYPNWIKPNAIKAELETLGHDLGMYTNPQASIQMVLKRMQSSDEVEEAAMPDDGKKAYRNLRGMAKVMKRSARKRAEMEAN